MRVRVRMRLYQLTWRHVCMTDIVCHCCACVVCGVLLHMCVCVCVSLFFLAYVYINIYVSKFVSVVDFNSCSF